MKVSDREFLILSVLQDSCAYGWEIVGKFPRFFARTKISIYTILKRMEKKGWIFSAIRRMAKRGSFRRYYELTGSGQKVYGMDPRRNETVAEVLMRIRKQRRRIRL